MPNLISPNELEFQSFLDDYFYHYLIFNLIFTNQNFNIFEANDNDYRYFKLQNLEGDLLCAIRLKSIDFHGTNFYCINKSKSIIEGKGNATFLYEYCFNNLGIPIISDNRQTKAGSSDLWSKLIKKNRNYQIFRYYTDSNIYVELNSGFDPYLVWGLDNLQMIAQFETPEYIYEDLDYDGDFENPEVEDILEFDYPYISASEDIHPLLIQFIKKGKVKDRYNVRLVVK